MIVAILACGGLTISIMQTLVLPLVPYLGDYLHTSTANASWVVTITLLCAAVSTPILGRLGDMFGKRRVMLCCALFVAAGSTLCALSTSTVPMIIGRGIQGLSFGLIPLGMGLMRDAVPYERLGGAIAWMSASFGIGGALGMPIAAGMSQWLGWHAPFWLGAGLGVLLFVLLIARVPESPVRTRERIDYAGALALTIALACLLLAISKGGDWGWTSPTTIGVFAAAVMILPLWARFELGLDAPIVDLHTSTRRPVLAANLTAIACGIAMYSMSLLLPRLLQSPTATGFGNGATLLETGVWLLPSGLAMMLAPPVATRLSLARGPKFAIQAGIAIIALGSAAAQLLVGHLWGVEVYAIVVSFGISLSYAPMPHYILQNVDASQSSAANGLNMLARTFGTASCSAIIGAVLGQMTTTVAGTTYPSFAGVRIVLTVGVVAALAALALGRLMPSRQDHEFSVREQECAPAAEAVTAE